MFSPDGLVDSRCLRQRLWDKTNNRNMNSFMVNQLQKARPNPVNIWKPFKIMLIFHAYFVKMHHRPLLKIHAEPVVCVINPIWRGSPWPGQWINLTAICFFMSVWCLNIHLDPSKRQTAVRTLRPLLSSYQQLLRRGIWGILELRLFANTQNDRVKNRHMLLLKHWLICDV